MANFRSKNIKLWTQEIFCVQHKMKMLTAWNDDAIFRPIKLPHVYDDCYEA